MRTHGGHIGNNMYACQIESKALDSKRYISCLTQEAIPIGPPRVDGSKDCLLAHQGEGDKHIQCVHVSAHGKLSKSFQKGSVVFFY